MTDLWVGIDVGTTRVKAGLVDEAGRLTSLAWRPTPWQTTDEGPVVDVVELADLVLAVAQEAAETGGAARGQVAGVGITGMAETGALLGPDDQPLAPGFAWHHTLGDAERVQQALGPDRFAQTTGHGCDLAPSIVKLDYLRSRGHRFRPGQVWLNIGEYIAYRLTGVRCCEFSLSGRTGLFDLVGRTWWDDALGFLGAGRWLLPGDPVPAGTAVGTVRPGLGLLSGAAVTVAGHDHPVAALACGGSEAGTVSLSLGTSEAHVRVVAPGMSAQQVLALVRLDATVDWHPLGDRWYVLSTLPTNLTLERLARLLGCDQTEARLSLSRAAATVPAAPGVRLVQADLDSFTLAGIGDGDTREGAWRAVMTQLVERAREHLDQVSAIVGSPELVQVFGGWSHDPLMARLRSELLSATPATDCPEPGIVGACVLARQAAEGVVQRS